MIEVFILQKKVMASIEEWASLGQDSTNARTVFSKFIERSQVDDAFRMNLTSWVNAPTTSKLFRLARSYGFDIDGDLNIFNSVVSLDSAYSRVK